MLRKLFLLLFVPFSIYASEVPNFDDISQSEQAVFFLSSPRSGSNLISASLSAITRKPVSWVEWKNTIFDPLSPNIKHVSYNRLGLPLISNEPVLYRTHGVSELVRVPSHLNKLILVTRNPKELLYRSFLLSSPLSTDPDKQLIKKFLNEYLQRFTLYDSWTFENRFLIFYEDFIDHGDEILLLALQFMDEEPTYWDDFIDNKEEYMSRLLDSYKKQHISASGGGSSREGPQAIHYSKNASPETLAYIDDYIRRVAPQVWEHYLKRFETPLTP